MENTAKRKRSPPALVEAPEDDGNGDAGALGDHGSDDVNDYARAGHDSSQGSFMSSQEDSVSEQSIMPLKRPRLISKQTDWTTNLESESDLSDEELPRKLRRNVSHVRVCGPEFPRSQYEGWTPPLEPSSEFAAIFELKAKVTDELSELDSNNESDYTYIELNDFSIYRPYHPRHGYELCALDRLQNRDGFNEFLFDGVLSVGEEQRFVQGARFHIMTVDGYGDPEISDLRNMVCIQSPQAAQADVWYRLGQPSDEYSRFFEPFTWLAKFTKMFVDYLIESDDDVTLGHFRRDFYGWLYLRYSYRADFRQWLAQCRGLRDFRTTVHANIGFLRKECNSVDDQETGLLEHSVWGEVDPVNLQAIPEQENEVEMTVVTEYAFSCFKHMYFSEHMMVLPFWGDRRDKILDASRERRAKLGLTPAAIRYIKDDMDTSVLTPKSMSENGANSFSVAEGDVVVFPSDKESRWRKTTTANWYAYVLRVHTRDDNTMLDVLWLYGPEHTTIGKAHYPFSHELFLSDNCDCGRNALAIESVIDMVRVEWFVSDPTSTDNFFVRQKFRTVHHEDTYDFVSLSKSDFKCCCSQHTPIFDECRQKYQIGDTVLVLEDKERWQDTRLIPAQIVDFLLDRPKVFLRRFRYKTEVDSKAKPNELVWTEEHFDRPPSKIIRPCHIRFYHTEVVREGLPTPYNQNGAGDFFFITYDSETPGNCTPMSDTFSTAFDGISIKPPLVPGWDPDAKDAAKKLVGMGIFCGGGNFDRGLEEGGAVQFEYAVDWAKHALHSYRANANHPDKTQFFLGSVNDYLFQALGGSTKTIIARVGDIEFLGAGSPCPGFSTANMKKNAFEGLRNASMVASVISYVDFYSPKYFLLENVVPMTQGMGPNKDENVFSQIIAALVGLGYQVQQFLMEAWSYGSSQQRSRVFIAASAPNLEPLPAPAYTHDYPNDGREWKGRKLGQSSNGLAFGIRRDEFTPFSHVSPLEATSDLPDIGDSQPQICPAFPDHRTASNESATNRVRAAIVPSFPRGMGLVQAVKEGRRSNFLDDEKAWCSPVNGEPLEWYDTKLQHNKTRNRDSSTVYGRVLPDGLFPTLLTCLGLGDGIIGRCLHWQQHRILTVMEARRIQGVQDHEVIIGSGPQQLKILGNSVDRKVALALGLALRHSWLKNSSDVPEAPIQVKP